MIMAAHCKMERERDEEKAPEGELDLDQRLNRSRVYLNSKISMAI